LRQESAQRISDAILGWRDADSSLLAEAPFEDADMKMVDGKHLGLRVTLAVKDRNDALIDKLEDLLRQLNGKAFENYKKNIDYIEILRIKATEEEVTAIEVVQQTAKREISWLNKGE
jgi:hypothetical protein